MDTVDHLVHKEGIEGQPRLDTSESCWKSTTFPWRPGRVAKLGTGFGD